MTMSCRSSLKLLLISASWKDPIQAAFFSSAFAVGAPSVSGTGRQPATVSMSSSNFGDLCDVEDELGDCDGDEDEFIDTADINGMEEEFSQSNESSIDEEQQMLLDFSIDSFLRGDYDRPFGDDAPAPLPSFTPQTTVEAALQSLRKLHEPEPFHGAAVLQRFLVPLNRRERWGDSSSSRGARDSEDASAGSAAWKEILRGAITPAMLGRRLRASPFCCLLDWERLDVSEGAYSVQRDDGIEMGLPSSVAFVNAALYFGDGIEPILVQFQLRKIHSVWLIDSAALSQEGLFAEHGRDD
jgi:hypothetical protein